MASEEYTDSMNLKVTELLKEVQLDYSPATTKTIDDVVSSIREAIYKIPEDLKVTADVAPNFIRDIGADKVEFKFKKPSSIEIGGSYSFHSVTKPDVNIDLFIRLPKECFHEKDYLNYRYHGKRCLYLCVLKKYLECSSSAPKVEWSAFQNEARKPILVIYPAIKLVGGTEFLIRLIPSAKSLFNIRRLNIERRNIRTLNQDPFKATPLYNSSILEDMLLEDSSEFVRKTFTGWKALSEALALLKVWARQRHSIYTHDCLNGYIISIIMSYLATESGGNRINNSMTAMQVFRIILDFIATSRLWDTGIFFKAHGESKMSKEERKKYLLTFPVVISDSLTHFNMAFRMTKAGLLELREEAMLALSCIDKCSDRGFFEIFMTKIDFPAKFDYCMRLNLKGKVEAHEQGFCLDNECWRLYEDKVYSLLQKGLGDRASFIRVNWRNATSISNINDGLSVLDREPLVVGISVRLPEAFDMYTRGPPFGNTDEARKFREFWGAKAELYQFKSGTRECAFWECKPTQRYLIIKCIAEHVLGQHLTLSKEKITHAVDQLDFSLVPANGDLTDSSGTLLEAFDNLSKRLRVLNGIPLKVSSVQPLDSAFRHTAVYSPRSHPFVNEKAGKRIKGINSTCVQPLEVMIQLEGSGNWPMNDQAIEKTKAAFLLKIAESLQKSWGMKYAASEENVDVFLSGYVFRLKILHERGLNLVKGQPGTHQVKRVSAVDRGLFLKSQHSSMINGLCGRYQVYAPVVRLAKRWIAAHLFSASFMEEAIELLVAYLFLKPLPFSAPCSRISGFIRFLRLLSEHDWAFSALIVDINGDITPDDEKEINEKFMLSRKAPEEGNGDVKPAMFLATTYDKASEAWTSSCPSLSDIKRLVAYAKSSSNLLTRLIMHDQLDSYGWECIFRTPLNNYNAIILLHRDKLAYPERLLFPSELKQGMLIARGNACKAFNLLILPKDIKGSAKDLHDELLIDFDPLRCFLKDLESDFPNTFKVWYDSLGGDAIGLTWKKENMKKRGRGDGDDEEEKDVVDTLKDVGRVGKGFVRSIHLLKVPKRLSGASLLIFANKQDIQGALSPDEIAKMSIEETKALMAVITQLSPEDLDKALLIVAQNNPTFQATGNEVDLDMDAQVIVISATDYLHLSFASSRQNIGSRMSNRRALNHMTTDCVSR